MNVRVPSKGWLIALLALVVVALGVFGLLRLKAGNKTAADTLEDAHDVHDPCGRQARQVHEAR